VPAAEQVCNAFSAGGRPPGQRAVEAEVFGRHHWEPVTSSDGVHILVARVRPRALNGGAAQ